MEPTVKKKHGVILISVTCLWILGMVTAIIFFVKNTTQSNYAVSQPVEATSTPVSVDYFANLPLEAKVVYVWDIAHDKALYSREAYRAFPLASLTKIMSAVVAVEVIDASSTIYISPSALSEEGDNGLWIGERWNVGELISFGLVTSSNDAFAAIAEYYNQQTGTPDGFVQRMNTKAVSLGLTRTSFTNVTGLDVNNEQYAANFGSARDIAVLFWYALTHTPEVFDTTRYARESFISYDQKHSVDNTNEIIDSIPWVTGSKTGFTDVAGGNLVVSFDVGIGRPIVVVVMGSSKEGRFHDMQIIIDAVFKHITASSI